MVVPWRSSILASSPRTSSSMTSPADGYGECLDYYRQAKDARGEAHALNNLAVVAIDEGRFQEASTLARQSLGIFENLATDERGKALVQRNLGWIATALAEYATAREWLYSSLAICRRLGDREGAASALNNLALISLPGRGQ